MKTFKDVCNSKSYYVISFICDIIALICATSVLVFLDDVWWLKLIYLIWHYVSITILAADIKNYREFKHKNERN